jgi:hypothetical protein
MAHAHKVYDSDTHFIIDTVTREILNETSGKTILIQNDHNAERFTFRIPKLVEGHDMSKCNRIEIHYINVDAVTREKSANVYESNDVQNYTENGEEFITFSWLISENATKYVGNLSFCIVFKCTTSEGDVDYRWHSAINSKISIASSINNIEEATEGYSDIIAQWKAELFEAGGNSVVNVNVARDEAIAAIKDEGNAQIIAIQNEGALQVQNVKDTAQAIENSRNQIHVNCMSKAAVISGEIEGEAIVINDSAKMPFSNLNVYGKSTQNKTNGYQLFNALGQQNNFFGNAEIAEKGRVITVTGAYYVSFPINLIAGENYYVDFKAETDDGNYGIRFEYADNSISDTLTNPNSFIPEKDVVSIYLYSGTGEEKTVIYKDVQICKGDIALEWEEFTGGVPAPNPDFPQTIESIEDPEIKVHGKNLINIDLMLNEQLVENSAGTYTITKNGSGGLRFSNKFSCNIPAGKYIFSVGNVEGTEEVIRIALTCKSGKELAIVVSPDLPKIVTSTEEIVKIGAYIPADRENGVYTTFSDLMMEYGENATLYEEYKESQIISIPHTLAGIPVTSGGNYTDADGQQWICDEVDFARGVYVQRCGNYIFDGSEDEVWIHEEEKELFKLAYLNLNNSWNVVTNDGKSFMSHYNYNGSIWNETTTTNGYCINFNSLFIRHKNITNLDSFKEHIAANPIELLYILTEPIEIALSDAEIETFKALVSNYPNTTILNDSSASMKVGYGIDTKMYIDRKIEELRKSILES